MIESGSVVVNRISFGTADDPKVSGMTVAFPDRLL